MQTRESYSTKQKDVIKNAIKNIDKEFSIKQLYNLLKGETGLTTIYRCIDKMFMNGELSKRISDDNVTYYSYLEKCDKNNHFYLKCEKCGLMEHVDCDCIVELENHILKNHNFLPNTKKIIISGLCKKCKEC